MIRLRPRKRRIGHVAPPSGSDGAGTKAAPSTPRPELKAYQDCIRSALQQVEEMRTVMDQHLKAARGSVFEDARLAWLEARRKMAPNPSKRSPTHAPSGADPKTQVVEEQS